MGKAKQSLLAKISPDGGMSWAKLRYAPNTIFFHLHADNKLYSFIRPNLKAVGQKQLGAQLIPILFALDYAVPAGASAESSRPGFAAILVPTVVLVGDKDRFTPPDLAEEIKQAPSQALT